MSQLYKQNCSLHLDFPKSLKRLFVAPGRQAGIADMDMIKQAQ